MIKINQSGIDQIFRYKIKESVSVEYFSANEIKNLDEKDALFLSQTICSMANAGGGVIFIGIQAQRKIPKSIDPLQNSSIEEWIDLVCSTKIFPEIPQLEIAKIVIDENNRFVIGISVPNSFKAPHMSDDKRFYKRIGLKTEIMEEYEIRNLYHKSKRPEIEIYAIVNTNGIPHMNSGKFELVNFYPKFMIKNISSAIEKFYKVEIIIPSEIHNPNFTALQNYFNRFDDGHTVFTIPQNSPIFQNEIATVAEGHFIVNAQSFKAFENGELTIKVFYSSGVQTRSFSLKETFLYKNKKIEFADFSQLTEITGQSTDQQARLF